MVHQHHAGENRAEHARGKADDAERVQQREPESARGGSGCGGIIVRGGIFPLSHTARRRAEPAFAGGDRGVRRQEREVFERGVVLHARVAAKHGAGADKGVSPNVYGAEMQPAILHVITGHAGVDADARAVAEGEQVVNGEAIGRDVDVAADLRAHQAQVNVQQRRAREVIDGDRRLDAVHEPEAKIVAAPQRITARAVTPDDEPLDRDGRDEHHGKKANHDGDRAQHGFPAFVFVLDHPRVGEERREPLHGKESEDEVQTRELKQPAARVLRGRGAAKRGARASAGFVASAWRRGFGGRSGVRILFRRGRGELGGEGLHGRMLVHVEHRDALQRGVFAQVGNHPRREERVSAEIEEEMIAQRNARGSEEGFPDGGDFLLQR